MKEKVFDRSKKGEKILRVLIYASNVAIMLSGLALAIYFKTIGDPDNRFLACIGMCFYGLIPFAIELISRRKLPNSVLLLFVIYVAVAGLWGSALNGYNIYPWLDIVVHCIMGYLGGLIALFLLCRTGLNKKLSGIFIVLFCVMFSLMIEYVWEVCEWIVDNIAGQNAQGVPPAGMNAPLVTDTMEDMICNLGGALVFALHYVISKFTKLNLGMNAIESEFEKRHKLFEKKEKTLPENSKDQNSDPGKKPKNEDKNV